MAKTPSASSASRHRARTDKTKRPRGRPPAKATLERNCVRRWRPASRRGPVCGYQLDGKTCHKRGAHYCAPRADRFVKFCAELLVHTKGPFARRAFLPGWWQEWEICRPLFGEVEWSTDWGCYARRYSVAYIVIGRKNGKSELAAAIVLYLLVGDDEEAAEIYGAAKDIKQASKVYGPVRRMVQLSKLLDRRLGENKALKRIFDDKSSSYYEVIASDALGELGHNPHGFILDEVLSQPDRTLWDALRTAAGARIQPLFLAITTETDDDASFGARLIDEAERIQANPASAPHIFAWVRKSPRTKDELAELRRRHRGHPDLPVSLDVFDEANWRWPNPALGTFKSIAEMRRQALEAREDPAKENAFRQFQMNQRVQQRSRWLSLVRWDRTAGMVDEDLLAGRACFAGLDLASTTDLAAWVLLFPPDDIEHGVWEALWRFWTPEAQVPMLDKATGGEASVWVRQGFLAATEGDWIDYWGDASAGGRSHHSLAGTDKLAIHPQIAADNGRYRILSTGYDQKEATATAQHMQGLGMHIIPIYQGFALSPALKEMKRLVMAARFCHGGHPVARFCADSVETRQDDQERIKVVKPDRRASGKRIDGIAAAATGLRAFQLYEPPQIERAPLLR